MRIWWAAGHADQEILVADILCIEPSNNQSEYRSINILQSHNLRPTFEKRAVKGFFEEVRLVAQGVLRELELLRAGASANDEGDVGLGYPGDSIVSLRSFGEVRDCRR